MDIVGFFSLLFSDQWVAQWVGVLAIVIAFIGFQSKKAHVLFVFQSITNVLWFVHMLLLGAYTGMILNVIGLVRSIFLFSEDKPWGKSKISMICITCAMLLGGVLTWSGWHSLLSMLAMAIGTPLLWTRKEKTIRISQICIISPLWLVHNVIVGSVAGSITETFNIISVAIALIRYGVTGETDTNKPAESGNNTSVEQE